MGLRPPEVMKVERQYLAARDGASWQKKSNLRIFSPRDFQESEAGNLAVQLSAASYQLQQM